MSYTAAPKTDDEAAATARRNALVEKYLPLATFIAKRAWASGFIRRRLGQFEEAVQAGCIGLVKAANGYRPEHSSHAKFITYASWAIYRAILREARAAGVIHIPDHVCRRLTPAELFRLWPRCIPPDRDPLDTVLAELDEYDDLHLAMEGLSPRQLAMLRERFGFCVVPDMDGTGKHWHDRSSRTLKAVGRRHGITAERARQIEQASLAELRAALS